MNILKKISTVAMLFFSLTLYSQNFPELSGWKISGDIKKYNPDNLWDRIDGGAEGYLKFDFVELQAAEYRLNDSTYITAEIYKFKNNACAFGIFSKERQTKATFLPIGVEGYTGKGILNFLADDCYIKLYSPNYSDETVQAMKLLAKKIADNINSSSLIYPALLGIFPEKEKIKFSEHYFAKDFLGYSFLKNVFQADYSVSGQTFNLFISEQETSLACQQMLSEYFKSCNITKKPKEGIISIKDKYNGSVILQWKGKYIWGLLNITDNKISDEYLMSVQQQLLKNKLIEN